MGWVGVRLAIAGVNENSASSETNPEGAIESMLEIRRLGLLARPLQMCTPAQIKSAWRRWRSFSSWALSWRM